MKFEATIHETTIQFDIKGELPNIQFRSNKKVINTNLKRLSANTYSLLFDGRSYYISINEEDPGFKVTINGTTHFIDIKNEQDLLLDKYGNSSSNNPEIGNVLAQIPGLLSKIFVSVGSNVKKGDKLFILEAMKMENEIDSPVSGIVKNIYLSKGMAVEKGTLIMDIG